MSQIIFNEIPNSIRKPDVYFELNTKGGNSALPQNVQKVLVIGQAIAGKEFGVPKQIFNTNEAEVHSGKGAIAHIMARDAIKANQGIQLFVVNVEDNASAIAAVRTLAVSGSAAEAGSFVISVNAQRFQINFAAGESTDSIAAKIKAAFDTDNFLPYTTAQATSNVTMTAISKGSIGSSIPIKIDLSNANSIVVGLTETTEGTGESDIEDTLTAIAGERYQVICSGVNDAPNLAYLKTYITEQSNALNKKAGRVHAAVDPDKTVSEAITLADGVNDGRCTLWFYRGSLSSAFSTAAAAAAVEASEEDPARSLNGLVLNGIGVPSDSTDYFSDPELEALLYGGIAPIQPTVSRTETEIVRWITTYTTDGSGNPDPTLLDGNTFKTLDYVRDSIVQRLSARYRRAKKTARILEAIRADVLDVLYRLEDAEIVENVDLYKDGVLVVPSDSDNNRANVKVPTDIVNPLHVIAGIIDLIL